MPTAVSATINPPGGVVTFVIGGAASGSGSQMTISRAVSGDSYSVLYSGSPQIRWADAGEQLPGPLSSGSSYYWEFTDSVGTVTLGPIQPKPYLIFDEYWLTSLLINTVRAGINNLILPAGVQRAEVFHEMPLNGFNALPSITITQELFQQDAIGIGQQVPNYLAQQNALWSMPAVVENTWIMTVFAKDVETREYYRDALIAIYQSSLYGVFLPLGQDITHRFMCHNYQWNDDLHGVSPGFYCCDIMINMKGMFTIGIQGTFPAITAVLSAPTASGVGQSGLVTGA